MSIPLGLMAVLGAGGGAAAGAYEQIATAFGTGSSGTITFSSIPSTYKHLQIRFTALSSAASQVRMQLNGDTGGNYAKHTLFGNGTSVGSGAGINDTHMWVAGVQNGLNSTAPTVAVIDILDYAQTTKNKTVRSFSGIALSASNEISLYSGLWMNTAAVNAISVFMPSGSFATTSRFSLYGIKG